MTELQAPASCTTCLYFQPGTRITGTDGTCHRHAPMQYTDDTIDEPADSGPNVSVDGDDIGTMRLVYTPSYFGWPAILATDWCGEHETRTTDAEH